MKQSQNTQKGLSNKFFQIPCKLIREGHQGSVLPGKWSQLATDARAVLPVLLSYSHGQRTVFPSIKTISDFVGLSNKTVIKGCRNLESHGIISVSKRPAGNGHAVNEYTFKLSPNKGLTLRIDAKLIEGGVWAKLKPTEKSVYLAIRSLAKPDPKADPQHKEDSSYGRWTEFYEFQEYKENRSNDYCTYGRKTIVAVAGIHIRSFPKALEGLQGVGLVRRIPPQAIYECPLEISQQLLEKEIPF